MLLSGHERSSFPVDASFVLIHHKMGYFTTIGARDLKLCLIIDVAEESKTSLRSAKLGMTRTQSSLDLKPAEEAEADHDYEY